MNPFRVSSRFSFRLSGVMRWWGGALLIATALRLAADPLACDLAGYRATPGLTASMDKDVLTVAWTGANGEELRARYAINGGQPRVRELAVRKAGGAWAVLGENLAPDFAVQTGRRPDRLRGAGAAQGARGRYGIARSDRAARVGGVLGRAVCHSGRREAERRFTAQGGGNPARARDLCHDGVVP